MMRITLLVAFGGLLCHVLLSHAIAQQGPTTLDGEVRGQVYHDVDGDGVIDPGEPNVGGQSFEVRLYNKDYLDTVESLDNGGFTFGGVPPGSYSVSVDLDQRSQGPAIAVTDYISFRPFGNPSFQPSVSKPWRPTTPNPSLVEVSPGAAAVIAFGAQPVDVSTVAGTAVFEMDIAAEGTQIEARNADQVCGKTTALQYANYNYELDVFGSGAQAGCPDPGDEIEIWVGGVRANERLTWQPFTSLTTQQLVSGFILMDPVAMEDNSWYWAEAVGALRHLDGQPVNARVDDIVCGETLLGVRQGLLAPPDVVAGFGKLIVPSDELQRGCGRPGAHLTFTAGDVVIGSTVWQPGIHEVTLNLDGLPILPDTGSGGPRRSVGTFLLGIVALAMLGATSLVLSVRRR
jgi:hypothetical protein